MAVNKTQQMILKSPLPLCGFDFPRLAEAEKSLFA
jgi:hypothetical protein